METSAYSIGRKILVCAAIVIILAGIRAAADIVIPCLLSVFIAILSGSVVTWLQRYHIPRILAIVIVVMVVMGSLTSIGVIAISSLQDFTEVLPGYQNRLEDQMALSTEGLREFLERYGITVASIDFWNLLDGGSAVDIAGRTLRQFGTILAKTFLIFLIVLFMLLEASRFPDKLSAAFGDLDSTWTGFLQIASSVRHFLAIKTVTSFSTGLLALIWLIILDVNYALFWALLAFLFNYIPNIGSFIAAVPAFLMAFLQYGITTALLVALGYTVINVTIGSLIEPHFMGDGLGLSPLIVFLSLVFWGWLLGGAGMLLSIPLTISVKIALEYSPDTRWISTLLGSGKS